MVGGKSAAPELLMRALYLSKIHKDSFGQCLADSLDAWIVGLSMIFFELIFLDNQLGMWNLKKYFSSGGFLDRCKDVALDEVEHAMLDPRVAKFGQGVTSRNFLHFLSELDMSRQDRLFQTCASKSHENL